MDITASTLPDGYIQVTCPEICLVLIQSPNNLEQVYVGFINSSDDNRTVVLSPGASDISVAVFTWRSEESIFSGQLSHISQPTSYSEWGTQEIILLYLVLHAF